MNRTTALLVALAILLGHALAIHKTASGEIAPPFDMAYVAFRVARNFVQTGQFAWQPGYSGLESYPSLLWIAVATVGERLYFPVNQLAQGLGMAAAFGCVLVLAQFSPVRLAGVIAPLLFVVSGGVASAALSGLETSTLALALALAFLAYERGWRVVLALSLALAVVTRPQGVLFAVALLAIELVRRSFAQRDPGRRPMIRAFVLPFAIWAAVALARWSATGHVLGPWGAQLNAFRPRVAREGYLYLVDFFLTSGNALLFVFPLWYLARGALGGLGTRACVLTVVWCAMVALGGGGSLPFFEAMTPILAILIVAVQEAMMIALDSKRRGLPKLTWVLFLIGLGGSVFASKYPGDLGPLPLEAAHRRWMEPRTLARFGYEEPNGRAGLGEEILATERLREIGIFLRDHAAPGTTVLTPWPGAIGYLSRLRVIDPLGRTTPSPGETRTRAWEGLPRADVVKALAERPDYIVPSIRFGDVPPTAQEVATEWAKSLDIDANRQGRSMGVRNELIDYELITVPITHRYARPGVFPRNQFHLMRRKDLDRSPRLHVSLDGRRFEIEVEHRAHEQLADLRVTLRARDGSVWSMRPTGEFEPRADLSARTQILLYPTGERRIRLVAAELPENVDAFELRAVLRNPNAAGNSLFTATSDEVSIPIGSR
jgi:arabinofuranosyltransferase